MTNSAHGTAAEVRAECATELMPVFDFLYELVREHAGLCIETAWPKQRIVSFGVGPKKMSEHHCYIAVYASHVNLGFYHGASLGAASGMLEGTGKGLRHIKLASLAAAKDPLIVEVIREAIADRERFRNETK
jgi:Domain of unknown function (DU1801)